MNVLNILEHEADFEPVTRLLVRSINRRLANRPQYGEMWVRLRPPTLTELENGRQQPSLIKFYRVASSVQIVKVLTDFIEVMCASHTMLFVREEFLSTFVKVQYWPGRESSDPILTTESTSL